MVNITSLHLQTWHFSGYKLALISIFQRRHFLGWIGTVVDIMLNYLGCSVHYLKMILEILQVTACVALIAAAMYWKFIRATEQGTHKFLFPYILVASALGIALLASYAMELFIGYYSGAIYEVEVAKFRYTGPYWWYYLGAVILPLLPIFGVLPQIGSRPIIVTIIGVLAMAPVIFYRIMSLFY
jgi:hypothetical protein